MRPVPYFATGSICSTPGALDACGAPYLGRCLARHMAGDWGSLDPKDKATNDQALLDGSRVLSAYPIDPAKPCRGFGENTIWVITESDRSTTTILLPSEY